MQTLFQKEMACKVVMRELWTSTQRQMHPLHYTVSYRGSFKPELPHFFIEKYLNKPTRYSTLPIVFDPFAGRGTTILEANLMGFPAWGNDICPLLEKAIIPLTNPPTIKELETRLNEIYFSKERKKPFSSYENKNLLPFYHPETLKQLLNLRDWLMDHRDPVDRFIEVIAMSRLHGHSAGFFSSYSFPQFSVPPQRQLKINTKHDNPNPKNIAKLILRKAKRSLGKSNRFLDVLRNKTFDNKITCYDSQKLPKSEYPNDSVDLVVTSPPFLAQVDYLNDNWLKFWFLRIPTENFKSKLVQTNNINEWNKFILLSLKEIFRILKPGSHAVVEVGDIRYKGEKINLDDYINQNAIDIGFSCERIMINKQRFTKLSNCFNVRNNIDGVNSNRCVVLFKPL